MDLSYFKRSRSLLRDIGSMPLFLNSSVDLLLASVSINILSLALPIMLMQVYDRIVPTKATSTLLWLAVGFFCALILESILRLCRSTISNWISARFEHSLAHACVARWLNCNLEDFEGDGAGVHLDRLRAVNALKTFYAGQAFQLILDLPFALIFLAVITFLGGWQVAVFVSGATLFFLVVVGMIRSRYSRKRLKQKQIADRRYNFLVESLGGIHTIKSITLEESMLRRHERLEAEASKNDYDVILVGNLPLSLGNMFSQIILFGVLFVGGSLVIGGTLTLGSLAACTLLSGRFFSPFRSLASFWVKHADVLIAKGQIKGIADLREESDPTAQCLPNEIDGSVELRDVTFQYNNNSRKVADGLSLRVEPGQMICLYAQGASGTTTLLNLLYGMLPPDAGRVFVDDLDLSEICHNDFKGRVEYIPQQGTLFNGTIIDNLTLFNSAHRNAAMDAAGLLQLDDALSELPLGYETQVGNRLYEFLPTGVIQRICLARALTIRPRIMLFDKINDAMDSESEQLFFWLLEKLKGNCTIVMATANPKILSMADGIYRLVDGKLIEMEAQQCF
ncbi:peptidase domain-containing ABC transporter [Pseudodesulfovibrio sediminis]|uniref:peptidase domain-containing ABC transporter n=1 Tax=Pseudodesulfovibrio sediminis TaxID=2810563 RepID=UPI001E4D3CC5|nr:ABC transporter transmembrane domain-containing protein [Pseudodesulfovibrio sediminis]